MDQLWLHAGSDIACAFNDANAIPIRSRYACTYAVMIGTNGKGWGVKGWVVN